MRKYNNSMALRKSPFKKNHYDPEDRRQLRMRIVDKHTSISNRQSPCDTFPFKHKTKHKKPRCESLEPPPRRVPVPHGGARRPAALGLRSGGTSPPDLPKRCCD